MRLRNKYVLMVCFEKWVYVCAGIITFFIFVVFPLHYSIRTNGDSCNRISTSHYKRQQGKKHRRSAKHKEAKRWLVVGLTSSCIVNKRNLNIMYHKNATETGNLPTGGVLYEYCAAFSAARCCLNRERRACC